MGQPIVSTMSGRGTLPERRVALRRQLDAIEAVEVAYTSLAPRRTRILEELHTLDEAIARIDAAHPMATAAPVLAVADEVAMIHGDAAPALHPVLLDMTQRTGLFALNISAEIRAIIEGPLHTGQIAARQRTLQPECYGPQCPRYLRMVPAHLNVDGALVAHLWVCQSCGRAQAPLYIGPGLPMFPAATAGLASRPMSEGRSRRTWVGYMPLPPGVAPTPAITRNAELTPVPEDDADDRDL
jgi:hypothetical protein